MREKIKIIGVGGSLDEKSTTLSALKFTIDELRSLGAETKIFDVREMKLPIYDPSRGIEQAGKGLEEFLEEVRSADGFIFASPEYHGTVSGAFKNVMDFLEFLSAYDPPYISGKPAGCIAIGGGEYSGVTTLQAMVNIVHKLRGISASGNLAIGSSGKNFSQEAELINDRIKGRLKRLAGEVFTLAKRLA